MTLHSSPHWASYERLVAALEKKMDPNAKVTWDTKVRGRSGSFRQLDVTVEGRIGSETLLLVVECKDYADKIGIEKIDAFISVLNDVGGNKGVIVSKSGFTYDALLRAENAGVIACVLRPANDADWQGYMRSMHLRIASMVNDLQGLTLELSNGEKLSTDGLFQVENDGESEFIDRIINRWLYENPKPDGELVVLDFTPPPKLKDDEREAWLLRAEFRLRRIEAFHVEALVIKPEDWVYMRQYSDGRVDDERKFFVFAELEALAKNLVRGK